MNVAIHKPGELLKDYIRQYVVIECPDETLNRVLPGTSVAVAFKYKGSINYISEHGKEQLSSSLISGLRKSARLINYTKNSGAVIVVFKESGAAAFFKEPLHELFDQSVSLDNLIKKTALEQLEDRLSIATENGQRISIIETFLLQKINFPEQDELIIAAVEQIRAGKGWSK